MCLFKRARPEGGPGSEVCAIQKARNRGGLTGGAAGKEVNATDAHVQAAGTADCGLEAARPPVAQCK